LKRRIYSETLPWPRVRDPATLALLRRYRLELVLAVRPWDLGELDEMARVLHGEGIALSLWPMLDDADGRWAGAHNAPTFVAFVERTLGRGHACDVLVDLEPPFAVVEKIAHGHGARMPRRQGYARGARVLREGVEAIRAHGMTASLAVWPLVALDRGGDGWQSLLGTPVDALEADHVSVMMYTSILEGWSRRTLRRQDTCELLAGATVRACEKWGSRAGVSLGCVGTGAFADEPVYRSPAELAEDVAIARAAGSDALSLFDLGGVLARPPAEAWLDAFTSSALAAVDVLSSRRVRAARTFARAATWALSRSGITRPRPA
jgi:hypothetical protein